MTRLPGAASTLVRDGLSGPARSAQVVGVHPTCVYLRVGADVLALETADSVGLPGAVRLGVDSRIGVLSGVRRHAPARVGDGELSLPGLSVAVVRWWRPRRPQPRLDLDARRVLEHALADRPPPVPVDAAVDDLLGLGPGLTPAGDDVLAGLLIGLHHHPARRDEVASAVLPAAGARTTALSATLLRHAALGHGVPALLDVADLLAGGTPPEVMRRAVDRLVQVGHSSGTAMGWGLLRAARSAAAGSEEAA